MRARKYMKNENFSTVFKNDSFKRFLYLFALRKASFDQKNNFLTFQTRWEAICPNASVESYCKGCIVKWSDTFCAHINLSLFFYFCAYVKPFFSFLLVIWQNIKLCCMLHGINNFCWPNCPSRSLFILTNIAGRLPENSRNSFVDLQTQKTVKEADQKNSSFHWRLICYILIKNLYKFLLPLLADLK